MTDEQKKQEKIAQYQHYIDTHWKHGATIAFKHKVSGSQGICSAYDGNNYLIWRAYDYFLESHRDFDLGI